MIFNYMKLKFLWFPVKQLPISWHWNWNFIFIGPKFDDCLVSKWLSRSLTNAFETWLMKPWALKIASQYLMTLLIVMSLLMLMSLENDGKPPFSGSWLALDLAKSLNTRVHCNCAFGNVLWFQPNDAQPYFSEFNQTSKMNYMQRGSLKS